MTRLRSPMKLLLLLRRLGPEAKSAREIAKCCPEIVTCARETEATPIGHGHAQVNHLRLRTYDWTQRLKTLPKNAYETLAAQDHDGSATFRSA